jgi:hypothetical protein
MALPRQMVGMWGGGRYGRMVDRFSVALGSDVMLWGTALAIFIFSGVVMVLMSHVH